MKNISASNQFLDTRIYVFRRDTYVVSVPVGIHWLDGYHIGSSSLYQGLHIIFYHWGRCIVAVPVDRQWLDGYHIGSSSLYLHSRKLGFYFQDKIALLVLEDRRWWGCHSYHLDCSCKDDDILNFFLYNRPFIINTDNNLFKN